MKRIILLSIVALIITACSSEKEGNMLVQGQIRGLKKGTLYLQKMQDTVLVSVDSISLLGDDNFKLTGNVEFPEMFYLTFKGNNTNNRILFFAEKGIITINDRISKFGLNPVITGSKNQEIIEKYYKMISRFNDKRLDLIKQNFDANKEKDADKITKTEAEFSRLVRRRYLYTTNYAITNADYVAAPYIALTELIDANIKLLDTINNSLSVEVKKSKYGKKLAKFITD
ncbi:MAG: DUF4369 domain-containing protein, partial [Flavobacteriaceae bacterium]|nr:DUF4369 domain-containing protein [Flavobacteriaceae bacterium]MBL4904520.1 DUF4369 domain-containing protein [Flavobacteriaceae bacterium]